MRLEPRRSLFAIGAAVLVTGPACDSQHGTKADPSAASSQSVDAPPPLPASAMVADAPASSATAAAQASLIQEGACKGRPVGAFACDGLRVVRCVDLAGALEDVRTCFSIERCEATTGACEPACPEGEVYIPATGPAGFRMGRGRTAFGFGALRSKNRGAGSADTPHKVVLTRPFCMDATEVTAGAMVDCVKNRGCQPPKRFDTWSTYPNKPDYPMNMVDWTRSKYFCEQHQKSLPTEAQWEWAATGGDGREWPWGNEKPTCERADYTQQNLPSPGGDAGCHGGGPSRVGSHPTGDKIWPTGRLHDLAGNVWEWVLDSYAPFSGNDEVDPVHKPTGIGNRVIRGGGWNRSHRGILAAFRGGAVITYQVPGLGFRCVRNPSG